MISLPRRARPRKFSEVIGQDLAVKLIHTGLKKDLLGNVCLIHGPAGVGKTTLARLIAQWFCCDNIKHLNAQEKSGDVEPCGTCQSCTDCIDGVHPDVFELDGASNTSVESIRTLLDGVIYKPVLATKKTYIIDEVHMLSRNAISALLKTLEEPNDHMQFVLATTELNKIPKTIISRCFRIPLDSIKKESMISHLKNLAVQNQINISDTALETIFFASYGSMRQAISILEQANLLCDSNITPISLEQMLGLTSEDTVKQLLGLIKNNDNQGIINFVQMINSQGTDPLILLRQLLTFLRIQPNLSKQDVSLGYSLVQSSLELHKSPYPNEILDICLLKASLMYQIAEEGQSEDKNEFDNTSKSSNNFEKNVSQGEADATKESLRQLAYNLFKE